MTLLLRKCYFFTTVVQICGIYSQQTGTINEYCFVDTFEPRCNSDEVIFMEHALYGRMQTGKCIRVDINLGCYSNELQSFDKKCSGQRSCDFAVLNANLIAGLDCLREMNPYLEASYACVKVYTPARSKCTSAERIEVTQELINLASSVSMTTSCGKHKSPWLLSPKPGQRVNITMTDFSWQNVTEDPPGDCITYGYIVEIEGDDVVTICGGRERDKHLYSSDGQDVQIILDGFREDQRFLLHIEAVGCPDIEAPAHATVERQGNSASVICISSKASWTLICVGNTWLGGKGSCPAAPTTERASPETPNPSNAGNGSKLPLVTQNHVIVITVACVTLLACTVIIMLGIYCTKRYGAKALRENVYNDGTLGEENTLSRATSVLYKPVYHDVLCHGSRDLLTHTPILERRQASCPNILDTPCEVTTASSTNGPCNGGYATVPRQDNPVLYYILENPEEENREQQEKVYQSLQRENRQLLG